MAFIPHRSRPLRESRPVLAVGQRAFVNCPSERAPVMITDERGTVGAVRLEDGAEVEVLAWRPRGSTGTRYRVRDRAHGSDGWLAAEELRSTAVRPPIDPARELRPQAPASIDTNRPFGSRR